uniref:SEA domain-containing protein n=1 Tax=Ditylenchus dipsaci TaxID=166011 RepID=A0A915EB91_9BILA
MPKKIEIDDKKPKDHNVLFSGESDLQIAPTPSPSNNHIYDVVVRLLNEKWHSDFENNQSQRYSQLSEKLRNILTPLISLKWSTLKDIRIAKFAEGSILALLQMEFDGEGRAPTAEELNEFLKKIAAKVKLET